MSADLSIRNFNPIARRAADSLLRSLGGCSISLLVAGGATLGDPGQIGIAPQTYQGLPLSPAVFRTVRAQTQEGKPAKFELMISGSAVQAQVNALELNSADALFAMAAAVVVGGKSFLIEAVSAPEAFGQAYLYRLQLREALPQGL